MDEGSYTLQRFGARAAAGQAFFGGLEQAFLVDLEPWGGNGFEMGLEGIQWWPSTMCAGRVERQGVRNAVWSTAGCVGHRERGCGACRMASEAALLALFLHGPQPLLELECSVWLTTTM